MTSKRPYLPLYVADYRADTHHLTTAQHGAYLLLLMEMWNDPDGSLPNNSATLGRICGPMDNRNWARTWSALKPLFQVVGDRLRHKRIDKEIAKMEAVAEARAAGGKLGGRPPRARHSEHVTASRGHDPDLFNENRANENLKVSPRARANSDSITEESPNGASSVDNARKKRASRIPEDFHPDQSLAVAKGLSPQQAEIEAEKFVNYWTAKSGANAVKRDWQATWRNWIYSAIERGVARTAPARAPPADEGQAFRDMLRQKASGG